MMNEFPPKYHDVVRTCCAAEVPLMNVTEYLEHLFATGVNESDLPALQPVLQKRIWDRMKAGEGPGRLAQVIDELRREPGHFHMDGGSWTNNLSWVRGYEDVLAPMDRVSALFHERVTQDPGAFTGDQFRQALFHLLCSQTSCFRYWGQGSWTDYGREICRRATELLARESPTTSLPRQD